MVLNILNELFFLEHYAVWTQFFLHLSQCCTIGFNTFPFNTFSTPRFGFSVSGTLITLVLDSLCSDFFIFFIYVPCNYPGFSSLTVIDFNKLIFISTALDDFNCYLFLNIAFC